MNARTKRRIQAAIVATALGSGITLLGIFAVMTAGGCAQIAAAVPELSMSGEITAVGDDSLTIKDNDAATHTIAADDATTYTLDGEEAAISSLKMGYTVNIILTSDGKSQRAKSVMATSQANDFSRL